MKASQPIPKPSSHATASNDDQAATIPVERWLIGRLKVNPLQADFFDDLPDQQLQLLAESLKTNGQEQPLAILPDGTIQRGHQRLRAAKLLGWKELDVKVRHDLQGQGPDAVKKHFLGDNVNRRQLRPLNKIRCIAALWDIAQKQPRSQQSTVYKKPLRDVIGEELNMSGRNLDRYLSILKAPAEVQAAFDHGQLSLNDGARVAHVVKSIQDQIVQAIRKGGTPNTVVRSLLPKKKPKRQYLPEILQRFMQGLQSCITIVQPRASELRRFSDDQLAVLEEAHTLIGQFLEQAQAPPEEDEDDDASPDFFDAESDDLFSDPQPAADTTAESETASLPTDEDADLAVPQQTSTDDFRC